MSDTHGKSSTRLLEEALEEAREEGYREGYRDGEMEAECDGEVDCAGYYRGLEDGHEEAETSWRSLTTVLHEAGFDALEDFVGRYDAARRVWSFTQAGRTVDVPREDLR